MEEARAALEKELDFTRMIRSRRYVHLALKNLLDTQVRKKLKLESQYRLVGLQSLEPQIAPSPFVDKAVIELTEKSYEGS